MMRFLFLILLFLSFTLDAQKGKDGVVVFSTAGNTVNIYTPVTNDVVAFSSTIALTSTVGFSVGDLILIIQMQGASVNCFPEGGNPNNSQPSAPNYGNITNYNNAGNNEMAQINSISGNTITVDCPLTNSYTASGKVQVVRVPRYTTLTLNSSATIVCPPWNGSTGGVIALEVDGNTVINSGTRIDASNTGFRGGMVRNSKTGCICGAGAWGHLNRSEGAWKGESIAGDTTLYATLFAGRVGKGAVANGGGGGTTNNGGGGGGANAGDTSLYNGKGNPDISQAKYVTAWNLETPPMATVTSSGGGRGGYTYANSANNPSVTAPGAGAWGGDSRRVQGGLGGRPLDYASGRIFLGGGGGGGDHDNGYGGAGGNGGGIIYFLSYGTISGGGEIIANGQNGFNTNTTGNPPVSDCNGRDGAGGGGGGGAIIIKSQGAISNLTVSAKGGDGGHQQMKSGYLGGFGGTAQQSYGPGGGGGGGYIANTLATITTSVNGGVSGLVQYLSGQETCLVDNHFPMNGATSGGAGISTTLTAAPTISLTSSSYTTCINSPLTLTAITTGTTPTSVNWYTVSVGGSATSGTTYITPSYTATGIYTVYVGFCSGVYRLPVLITVNNGPTVTVNSPTICPGETITLTANGATNYTWSTGASSSTISVSPAVNTTYTVTGANGSCTAAITATVTIGPGLNISVNSPTICSGQTALLTPTSIATSYTWSTGANTNTIEVSPGTTTVYTLTGSNGGCSGATTATVTVQNQPTLSISGGSVICSGQTLTLTASGANTYTWLPSGTNNAVIVIAPPANTSYSVIGEINTCTNTAVYNITVTSTPTLTINSTTICSGQSGTLTVSGAVAYTWNPGGLTTTSIVVTPTSTSVYSVTGANGNCISTNTTEVVINTVPPVNITVSKDTICLSNCISFTSTTSGVDSLLFDFSDGTLPAYSSIEAVHCYTNSGTYTVTATASYSNGCQVSAANTLTIVVHPKPFAFFNITGGNPQAPGTLIYFNNTSAGDNNRYSWYFGSAATSTLISPSFSYQVEGNYCVGLVATDTLSKCKDSTYQCLDIINPVDILIPNVFTPNNDGVNDLFKVSGVGIVDFRCEIYDRWGIKLYEWDGLQGGWDGKTKSGLSASSGTYFFLINYYTINGKEEQVNGHLSLFTN